MLAAIPGRKSVIHFTGGITQTGEENRTELRAATDAANRADTSIYEIDARGLFATPPGGDVTASAATGTSIFSGAAVFRRRMLASILATRFPRSPRYRRPRFLRSRRSREALPEIQADNMGYYLASYVLPSNTKHDGSWHQIRVKVTGVPGAHVKSRDGYYAPRDFQHLMKQDKEDQLEEALESDDPIVELPIAVETAAFRVNPNQVYVPISAKISSSALDWAQKHDEHQVGFDFAYEVRVLFNGNPTGIPIADKRDTINVKLDAANFDQVKQNNLVYQGGVLLAPGRTYRLKFIARENESGKLGTFEQNISIPTEPADRMTLSSVLLSSQIVPVTKQSSVSTKSVGDRAKNATTPLITAGEEIVPSVTRFFNTDQTLYVFFQAYYPDKGENVASLSTRFDSRRARFLPQWSAGQSDAARPAHGLRRRDAHRNLPHQLAAGETRHGPLHRASRRYRAGHAAIRLRPCISRARRAARRYNHHPPRRCNSAASRANSGVRRHTAIILVAVFEARQRKRI